MKRGILLALITIILTFSACGTGQGAANSASLDAGSTQGMSSDSTPPNGPAQSEAAARGRIRAVVSKNCNYVYHMLAVSGCGYLNEYGERYQSLHPAQDLQTLNSYERYLTVAGGEYQGELYFLCVTLPASLDDGLPVTKYYEALADLFSTGEIEKNFEAYQDVYEQSFSSVAEVSLESFRGFYSANEAFQHEISEIAAVMHRNGQIYSEHVWEATEAELSAVASSLNEAFGRTDYAGQWEELLDCQYGQDSFLALLCNSMENGPNCINISAEKDVFYPSGDIASTVRLINHEFGIFLLMDVLADTEAFQDYSYFKLTEALAEFYNTVVTGGHTDWDWGAEFIAFYSQLKQREPGITAREMFLRAADHFGPDSSAA